MSTLLTFVIPVRHPENCADWPALKKNLAQTVKSIAAQSHSDWRAVIVANQGADLPPLPEKFAVCRVDFPPNPLYDMKDGDREIFYDAVRFDKGRRLLAGMLEARESDYFMVVDDDDFVSRDLVRFTADNRGRAGWYFKRGFAWAEGGNLLYLHPGFSKFCGTSHIVRADLMALPETFADATDGYIKQMLGSHIFIERHLAEIGQPLAPLPFPGAVYRIGHAGAHSRSSGLARSFFLKKNIFGNPLRLIAALGRLRLLTPSRQKEFFGRA